MNDQDFKALQKIYSKYKDELRDTVDPVPQSFVMLRNFIHGEARSRDMFDTGFAKVQDVEKGG